MSSDSVMCECDNVKSEPDLVAMDSQGHIEDEAEGDPMVTTAAVVYMLLQDKEGPKNSRWLARAHRINKSRFQTMLPSTVQLDQPLEIAQVLAPILQQITAPPVAAEEAQSRNEAAISIQRAYRKYSQIGHQNQAKTSDNPTVDSRVVSQADQSDVDEKEDAAARYIQRYFRDHRNRRLDCSRILVLENAEQRPMLCDTTATLEKEEEEQVVESEQPDLDVAATKIQNWSRKQFARRKYLWLRWAAIITQRAFRERRRLIILKRHWAAVKIQSWIRGHACRNRTRRLLWAIAILQAYYRGRQAREAFLKLKQAAIVFPKHWRGRDTRRKLEKLVSSVVFIQDRFRYWNLNRKTKAAVKIQAWVRGHQVRNRLRWQMWAAAVIKAQLRGYIARKDFRRLKKAAVLIQAVFRGLKPRIEFQKLRHVSRVIQRRFRWKRRWKAAVTIQSWLRGCLARYRTKWTLPKAVVDHQGDSASVLLLLVGGFNPEKPRERTDRSGFDNHQIWRNELTNNRWELIGHMVKPLRYPGYALQGHYIYVTGGWDKAKGHVSDECHVLNIHSGKWSIGPKLTTGRNHHGCCSSGDVIVIFGGIGIDNQLMDSIELLNGESTQWLRCKSRLEQPRAAIATVESSSLFGRLIWLCGGVETYGQQLVSVNVIECYDLANDIMVPVKFNLLGPRAFASATLCEGVVYVVGGEDGDNYQEDIEAFRLESLKPTRVGALKKKRRGARAVTHNDCVVVVGGQGPEGVDVKEIEILSRHRRDMSIADLPKPLVGFGCFIYRAR